MRLAMCIVFLAIPAAGLAQTWEAGGAAGAGFARGVTVTNATGRARAGFANSPAFGVYIGQNLHKYVGGEIRYTYRPGDLSLSSGPTRATFDGQSHLIHYDVLVHVKPAGSRIRLFLAAGAGARVFRGTGREAAYQPLQQFALLTKTQEAKPLVSLGAGVKAAVSPRLVLRVEFRDYISPFPTQVITPAIGSKLGGWLHDIVPFIGVAVRL
jgi:hypothetical protein